MTLLSSLRGAVAVALAAAIPLCHVSAADAAGDSLLLGNSRNKVVGYLTAGGEGKSGFALYYPAERMQAYRGCEIAEVVVNINYTSGMGPVRVFVSGDLDGEAFAEHTFQPDKNGWTTVRLDSPYSVDGSAVYIGYEGEAVKYLTYGTPLIEGEEWVRRNDSEWQPYNDGRSAAMYALVRGEALPKADISMGQVVMPGYARTGSELAYEGTFVNLGADTVRTMTVALHAGDTRTVRTIDGLKVAPRTEALFTAGGFTIGSEGDYETWIEVEDVNGTPDAAPYDNASRHKPLVCREDFTPRKVLMEVFSTERCTNCPNAHKMIAMAFEENTDIVEIGHHAGFYDDALTIAASVDYEWFYRKGNLYAPAVMFDRTAFLDNRPSLFTDTVPPVNVSGTTLPVIYGEAAAVPAFVSVGIEPELDTETRRLTLKVSGQRLLADDTADPRLFVFLTEDSIYTTTQAGASSGFYHRFAARAALTPTWGEPVDIDNGFAKEYSMELPEEWNMANMRAVAFVAGYDPDDKLDCRVMNTAEEELMPRLTTAISEAGAKTAPLLTVAARQATAPRGFDRLTIYDMAGRIMADMTGGEPMSRIALPHGGCIIRVVKDGDSEVMKLW